MNRRLYRCRDNRVLAGVAAGVAEFFDLDPTLVRVLWFVSIFFGGVTLLLYIGLALITPLEPLASAATTSDAAAGEAASGEGAADSTAITGAAVAPEGHRHATRGSGRMTIYVGMALILFGTLALIDALLPGVASWRYLWPVFLVGIGALLIAGAVRRERNGL